MLAVGKDQASIVIGNVTLVELPLESLTVIVAVTLLEEFILPKR
jgi:hypothetical protein